MTITSAIILLGISLAAKPNDGQVDKPVSPSKFAEQQQRIAKLEQGLLEAHKEIYRQMSDYIEEHVAFFASIEASKVTA